MAIIGSDIMRRAGILLLDEEHVRWTLLELAEWKVRHEHNGVRIVVGIEEGFSGARYIRHRLGQDCPGIPIVNSLEAACRAVVELLDGAGR